MQEYFRKPIGGYLKMNFGKMFVLLLVLIVASSFANAQNLEVAYLRINGEPIMDLDPSNISVHDYNLEVARGDNLDIKVRVYALADVKDVQIEADIYGYKYAHKEENKVSDTSKTFDMSSGDYKTVDLNLEVPVKMDKDYIILRIRVGDKDGLSYEKMYQLHVVGIDESSAVMIRDYSFSPSSSINAGRAFTATVKVENLGDYDLDDIKVTVAIPELNIQDSEYLDELEADEKETLEEFLLRIPDCAEVGDYEVVISVDFDEYESTEETTTIRVLAGDACIAETVAQEKTIVSLPEKQTVKAGEEVAFPIMVTNDGKSTKIYTVTVSGADDWASISMNPGSQIVVAGGSTEVVYLTIQANKDAGGEKVLIAQITSGNDKKTIPLTVSVEDKDSTNVKKGLEIALVILVIILILIGLIIGFTKLRRKNEDETQTYY